MRRFVAVQPELKRYAFNVRLSDYIAGLVKPLLTDIKFIFAGLRSFEPI